MYRNKKINFKNVREFLIKYKYIKRPIKIILKITRGLRLYLIYWMRVRRTKEKSIYYLGAAKHANLGDLAQSVCIRSWIEENYSEYMLVEVETNVLVSTYFSLVPKLKKIIKNDDLIIFQSGYTTTDLGGNADEMHRVIIKAFPNVKMLMMPQTIFYQKVENEKKSSKAYDGASKMLFLARDQISYEKALYIFKNIKITLFPDIVTTLIGNYSYNYEREGILFCCRNDDERYYTFEQIKTLRNKLSKIKKVNIIDTSKENKDVIKNAAKYVDQEVENYSKYKMIITDRFHGTIFALASNTPVIVLKTKDHKVVAGAEWFLKIYEKYIFVANSLEEVEQYVNVISNSVYNYKLKPYFKKNYYDKLPKLWF